MPNAANKPNDPQPVDPPPGISVTLVGGPTVLFTYAGLRFLTDPTFDPPAEYGRPPSTPLVKTHGPAIAPREIGTVDIVLLSHDQHPDNLDTAGRAVLTRAGRVITTTLGAGRLETAATGLEPWSTVAVGNVEITAVPAQHGPDGNHETMGPVLGFVLRARGLPSLYISGDNASVGVVEEIAARLGSIDLAILFVGAAARPGFDDFLTLSSERAVLSAAALGAKRVTAVHVDSWAHFTQDAADVVTAFERAGMAHVHRSITPGQTIILG